MQRLSFISEERLSQAQFARWLRSVPANDLDHYELLDGHVVREPPAGWPHGEVAAALLLRIGAFVEDQRLGRIFDSSQGFELPSGDTVEPDVSFVSNDNWSQPKRRHRFLQLVPDLVVEVLSPSTSRRDRHQKKRIYERNGVREYWLVDTNERRVNRFALEGDRFDGGTVFEGPEPVRSSLLAGLSIPLARIFR